MTQTQPQFKVGDRCFSHYTMKWGTIAKVGNTDRDRYYRSTGKPEDRMDDTTWYDVRADDGSVDMLDDAHGNWEMARVVPPNIALDAGYGVDPNPCHYPNLWYNATTGKCDHPEHDGLSDDPAA